MDAILYKLLTKDKQARIYLIDNSCLARDIGEFNNTVVAETFYTLFTFTCILHGIITNAKRLTVKLETSNPSSFLICGADANGNMQGYISDDLSKESFKDHKSMLGEYGCLKIIQDDGAGSTFTGIVEARYDNISDNIAHYFLQSEQTRTTFRCFHEIKTSKLVACRGVMVQALPFADEGLFFDWKRMIEERKDTFIDSGCSSEALIESVFSEAVVVETWPVRLMCACSRETILEMLLGLGASELEWTFNDNQNIEVRCNKCGRRYTYSADEIRRLM